MMQKAAMYALSAEYKKKGSSVMVLYGREGCGKEECLREFLKGRPGFYYRARSVSQSEQRESFLAEAARQYSFDPDGGYKAFFACLADGGEKKKVVAIDEFDRVVRNDPGFSEALSSFKQCRGGEALVLLCTSSVLFAEHKMKDAMGEAFFTIDQVCKIKDLDFVGLVRRFPDSSVSECVKLFGILGGTPSYLGYWDESCGAKENVCREILSPNGRLFYEAERFLRGQLRELSVYNTILTAIAQGCRTLNGLHRRTGFSRAKISVYLGNLTEFDVVEKVISYEAKGTEPAQKGVYRFKNAFLHFWFRFVFPHSSDLFRTDPETFYEKHIAEGLDDYLEEAFAAVCTEYMKLMNRAGKLPIQISKIATWVGKSGTIDIVAQNAAGEVIAGICNWKEEEMPYERYARLKKLTERAGIVPGARYLFSGKSFAPELREAAKRGEGLVLIDMTEL